ncbi:MAG: hypothetical protein IIW10_01190, partial [Spirochaetaceae bacterium]|nr:hypothetical protein [Spirochaetaceae bacterium]
MDKNTIAFIVASTAIIIGGYYLNIKMFPPQPADEPAPVTQVVVAEENTKSEIFEIQNVDEAVAED